MKKTALRYKENDWVSVQPMKKGKPNGPRVNGMIRRVHRKGYYVEYVLGEVHPNLYESRISVEERFDFELVRDAIAFTFTTVTAKAAA